MPPDVLTRDTTGARRREAGRDHCVVSGATFGLTGDWMIEPRVGVEYLDKRHAHINVPIP